MTSDRTYYRRTIWLTGIIVLLIVVILRSKLNKRSAQNMTSIRTNYKRTTRLISIIVLPIAVVLVIAITLLIACSSPDSGTSEVASTPKAVELSGLIQESGILISNTGNIPNNEIVAFNNLVIVSYTGANNNPQSLVRKSVTGFVKEVKKTGANAVIGFNFTFVSHGGRSSTILYGMAVVIK